LTGYYDPRGFCYTPILVRRALKFRLNPRSLGTLFQIFPEPFKEIGSLAVAVRIGVVCWVVSDIGVEVQA
jgi:hypothetical protein